MSLEIKSIEVENDSEEFYIKIYQNFGWRFKSSQRVFNQSSRPVCAFSYDGVTYVRSETETVDFTKLVFERDTKMRFYEDFIKLESEFWELSEIILDGKPYMPPHAETIEDWANHFKPEVRSKSEIKRLNVTWGVMIPSYILIMALLMFSCPAMIVIWGVMLAVGFYGLVIARPLVKYFSKKKALNTALIDRRSEYGQRLECMYNDIIKKIDNYNDAVARMNEILESTNELLDML